MVCAGGGEVVRVQSGRVEAGTDFETFWPTSTKAFFEALSFITGSRAMDRTDDDTLVVAQDACSGC